MGLSCVPSVRGRLWFSSTDQFILITTRVQVVSQKQGGNDTAKRPDVDGLCDRQAQDYLRSPEGSEDYTHGIAMFPLNHIRCIRTVFHK